MGFTTPGASEINSYGLLPFAIPFEITYDLASGTYTVPVNAGTFVFDVATVVTTVFDGSPSLTIGDGDDADGFGDNTDLALGTAATGGTPAIKLARNSSNPYANGKYYAADDTVDLVWTKGTNPTTGKLKGYLLCFNVQNGGIAATA